MITKKESYDLSARNTFGMKVSCRLYVEVTEPEDLLTLDFDALPQPLFVMGGGSNLLFTKDFPGTVLHLCNKGISIQHGLVKDGRSESAMTEEVMPGDTAPVLPGESASVIPGLPRNLCQFVTSAFLACYLTIQDRLPVKAVGF